jgi:hypothetical protein
MKNRIPGRAVIAGIVMLALTSVAISSQMDHKFAEAQQQNAQALKRYSWKCRTEIHKGGETKAVQLALLRYDIYGSLQKTPISSTPQQQLPTRGLRGLIAQKKKESFTDTLERLSSIARAYAELSPDSMQRFVASATVMPEMNQQQKMFRISGGNILQAGDSMTLWVDAMTKVQRHIEIRTSLDRKPVRIISDFQSLPAGPNYVARSVVDYPSEEIRLITENFDYQLSTR